MARVVRVVRAVVVELSGSQRAVVSDRGAVTLLRGREAWFLDEREARRLVEVLSADGGDDEGVAG